MRTNIRYSTFEIKMLKWQTYLGKSIVKKKKNLSLAYCCVEQRIGAKKLKRQSTVSDCLKQNWQEETAMRSMNNKTGKAFIRGQKISQRVQWLCPNK